jgi:hypothetical protein
VKLFAVLRESAVLRCVPCCYRKEKPADEADGPTTSNTATQEVKIPFEVDTSRLMAFSVVVDNSIQTLTVLDPVNQSLAVYHIYLDGPDVGRCELKSVRNISADLKFYDYDSMKPFPGEVQAIIDQQTKQ